MRSILRNGRSRKRASEYRKGAESAGMVRNTGSGRKWGKRMTWMTFGAGNFKEEEEW